MKISLSIIIPFLAIATGGDAFTFAPSTSLHLYHIANQKKTTSSSTTQLKLQKSVQDAITEAQRICAVDATSNECKVAWDIVEELEAAESHRSSASSGTGEELGPDIETFLDSLDVLTKKIDGKMDQLKGISYKLQELGATDPSIGDLAYQADVMKQVIYNARASLGRY